MADQIIVGKILSAHGIRGEVKVKLLSDNPRRFRRGSSLFIEKKNAYFKVSSVRAAKDDLLIVKFAGIDDRSQAELLKASFLQVEEASDPPADDVFYHYQLIGMEVFEEDGSFLGTIREIIASGSNDVYRVVDENGDGLLLPALKQVVLDADVARKKMIVRLLPGLREACAYHEG